SIALNVHPPALSKFSSAVNQTIKLRLLMKKILLSSLAGVALLALATPALAEEKTITGEGKCAKCALHETDKCQNVIQAKEGDKTVTYYQADNDVSKAVHND